LEENSRFAGCFFAWEMKSQGMRAAINRRVVVFASQVRWHRKHEQEDLATIVPQSNLSAILAGKRKISATLAGKLGKFFGMSPAVFVPV